MKDEIKVVEFTKTHERFNRKVWAFKNDFTGALAKWLVKQSPYTVPDNLSECISEFDIKVGTAFDFDTAGMAEIELGGLTDGVYAILESIPVISELNVPKSGHDNHVFVSARSARINPDDDFIDIMAVAQNITCEFADRVDAESWLDHIHGDSEKEIEKFLDEVSKDG